MKIIIIAISLLFSLSVQAQNARMDKDGNYVYVNNLKADSVIAKETGKTFTAKDGKVYPVYVSDKGKLFVKKVSKSGNAYNMYLKL